jgi:hypothetical protein
MDNNSALLKRAASTVWVPKLAARGVNRYQM